MKTEDDIRKVLEIYKQNRSGLNGQVQAEINRPDYERDKMMLGVAEENVAINNAIVKVLEWILDDALSS